MANVHMMIGIPGSGKSTFSNILNRKYNYIIVSTDVVRKLHPDWEENLIWPEVYRLIGDYLKNGQDVIFDATNITPKVRARFIEEVNKYCLNYEIIAYYFDTPLDVCIKRVSKRNENPNELFLPLEVISSYHEKIVFPLKEEGFVKIINALEMMEVENG